MGLKEKTKKGLLWSAAGNLSNQGIRFLFGLILARLLSPNDYGVIGMLTVFMCVINTFVDCGFSQALIAKQDRTQTDFSTEFWFNVVVGLVGYGILFVIAPFVATFYQMPILTPVLKVLGIGVFVNSLCVVQSAQFAVKLDFKRPAQISAFSQASSGVVGLVLAFRGFGVWSLVVQQIAGYVINAILLWSIARWRPTFVFSKTSFRYLWNYGSNVLGTGIIQQIYDNLYPLIIGKFFSAQSLGLYTRALHFASLPSSNVSNVLGQVTFPILSKINNDEKKLMSVYERIMRGSAFLVFPLMMGLAAISSPLVKVLLNEQWYACIPLLKMLCFALVLQPLSFIQLNMLKVVGRTDMIFNLEIIKRIVGVLSIVLSISFGLEGMCVAYILLYIVCFLLNTFSIKRVFRVDCLNLFKSFFVILVCSIAMNVFVSFITTVFDGDVIALIVGVCSGALFYYCCSCVFMNDIKKDLFLFLKGRKNENSQDA